MVSSVTVSPANATVPSGTTEQFSADVVGDETSAGAASGVTWKVEPANGAGKISPSGLYTAPDRKGGSAKVVATSKADPSKHGSASVTF